jgi:hypothetical protein
MQMTPMCHIWKRKPSRTPASVARGEGPREVIGLPGGGAIVEVLRVVFVSVLLLRRGPAPAHRLPDDPHPQRAHESRAACPGSRDTPAELILLIAVVAVSVPNPPTQTRAPELPSRLATTDAWCESGRHGCLDGLLPPEHAGRERSVAAVGAG